MIVVGSMTVRERMPNEPASQAALEVDPALAGGDYESPPAEGLKAMARVWAGWGLSQRWYWEGLYRRLGFETVDAFIEGFWEPFFLGLDANNLLNQLWTWQHGDISATPGYDGDFAQALEADGGSIVNTSSVWGAYAAPGNAAYHASKGAVTVLSKNAALTYARQGIRVNALLPGYTDTPMVRNVTPEEVEYLLFLTPIGRIGPPAEVASLVVHLASDESSFTRGGVFFCDGGMAAM